MVALTLTTTVVVAVAAGCNSETTESSTFAASSAPGLPSTAEADGGVSRVALSPRLDHVHGLHIDADGTILAGTHSGVWAVNSDGNATKVGSSDDDLMGFSGASGTDTLVTSGHPGPSSEAPNPLGLRRSNDGGRTWMDQSLGGEVDFHALATDGAYVIGFDGTTGLRVSVDGGLSWSPGAALAAASLTIGPGGVWALTTAGVQRSIDDGSSFEVVGGAPDLMLLAGTREALWGIDGDGNAWRSHDGDTWEKRSFVGSAEALTADGFATAYAATGENLHVLS
ncbi:exo-alpha-sialidase [Gordonia sp. HNM0687]|uniref:Exo-alpha-sialidase n=1 Tax=Gordonia mangrovi TaxID=2665643 RepID=A0A6L7GMR2_9ACTN|nr:exo-alpha-sialidase [Gordonia mangrovi]